MEKNNSLNKFNVGDLVKSKVSFVEVSSTASFDHGNGCVPVSLGYFLADKAGCVKTVLDESCVVNFCIDNNCYILIELPSSQIYLVNDCK